MTPTIRAVATDSRTCSTGLDTPERRGRAARQRAACRRTTGSCARPRSAGPWGRGRCKGAVDEVTTGGVALPKRITRPAGRRPAVARSRRYWMGTDARRSRSDGCRDGFCDDRYDGPVVPARRPGGVGQVDLCSGRRGRGSAGSASGRACCRGGGRGHFLVRDRNGAVDIKALPSEPYASVDPRAAVMVSELAGSASGPVVRGAYAGLPTIAAAIDDVDAVLVRRRRRRGRARRCAAVVVHRAAAVAAEHEGGAQGVRGPGDEFDLTSDTWRRLWASRVRAAVASTVRSPLHGPQSSRANRGILAVEPALTARTRKLTGRPSKGFVRWKVYRSRVSATFVVVMNVDFGRRAARPGRLVAPSTAIQRTRPGCVWRGSRDARPADVEP